MADNPNSALSLATVGSDGPAQHEDEDVQGGDAGEEEEIFDDNDSAFGGSLIGSDTDTLASYITDYRYENGRRYHSYRDGEYWVRCVIFGHDRHHVNTSAGPKR